MKIILLNPVTRNGDRVLRVERCQQKILSYIGAWPPITLLEIAAYLRYQGFNNIEIIDGEVEKFNFNELVLEITKRRPDVVVIQATTPTIQDDILFASFLKQKSNEIIVIFIGLHATILPQELLKQDSIDHVILGEPENTISELMSFYLEKVPDMKDIRGLGYKHNGKIIINEKRLPKDNYDYPIMPDRSLVKNEKYILPLTKEIFTVIKTSRGCNFECLFCTSASYYGRGWRARTPENIIEEIKEVRNKHGISMFLFLSDTFNGSRDFVRKLCSKIIEEELNIKWASNSRVDLVDDKDADLMKRAGCVLVSIGIESYDEGILKKNRKNINVKDIDNGINFFSKYGIKTYGYFIFGLEGEDKKSILRTIIKALNSKLDFANFYSLTPYPGTWYFDKYKTRDYKEYFHGVSNIVGYNNLSRFAIRLYRYIAFILFYLRPRRFKAVLKYFLHRKVLC